MSKFKRIWNNTLDTALKIAVEGRGNLPLSKVFVNFANNHEGITASAASGRWYSKSLKYWSGITTTPVLKAIVQPKVTPVVFEVPQTVRGSKFTVTITIE